MINQVLERVLAQDSQNKETTCLTKSKSDCFIVHFLSNDSDTLDDEGNNVYAGEFVRSSKVKSHICASLKPVHRNWQDELKYFLCWKV
jgi:hypothetical protein